LARAVQLGELLGGRDCGFASATRSAEPSHDVEELLLARLWAERWNRPLGVRHPEKIEHETKPIGQRFVEQEHPPGDLVSGSTWRVLFGDAEIAAERLEDRKPRHA